MACFYVKLKGSGPDAYYRAIYLSNRTMEDLIGRIAAKFGIKSSDITKVTHVTHNGLTVLVDDEVVRELREGQDMLAEFASTAADEPQEHVDPSETQLDRDSAEFLDLRLYY